VGWVPGRGRGGEVQLKRIEKRNSGTELFQNEKQDYNWRLKGGFGKDTDSSMQTDNPDMFCYGTVKKAWLGKTHHCPKYSDEKGQGKTRGRETALKLITLV